MKEYESQHREVLEEHARNPLGEGELENATDCAEWSSLKTGNRCSVQLRIKEGKIWEVKARVEGSALARACASIMCGVLESKSVQTARKLKATMENWADHGKSPEEWEGDLAVYQSLGLYPERMDCAMLPWRALRQVLGDQ